MLCIGQNKAWARCHESPLSQKDTNHFELLFLNIYRYETIVTNLDQMCTGRGSFSSPLQSSNGKTSLVSPRTQRHQVEVWYLFTYVGKGQHSWLSVLEKHLLLHSHSQILSLET